MRQLRQRTAEQGVEHHKQNPVRVYHNDGVQDGRIARARLYLAHTLQGLRPGRRTIVELGCGAMDISGPFSGTHEVIGMDCNQGCVLQAMKDYPNAVVSWTPLEGIVPFPCDVLVLCEVLEHLTDPIELVKKWLPHARACVISHPIEGDLQNDLSGGDHCWSYSQADLHQWFVHGGHLLMDDEIFPMGSYRIGIARGFRKQTA